VPREICIGECRGSSGQPTGNRRRSRGRTGVSGLGLSFGGYRQLFGGVPMTGNEQNNARELRFESASVIPLYSPADLHDWLRFDSIHAYRVRFPRSFLHTGLRFAQPSLPLGKALNLNKGTNPFPILFLPCGTL